MILALGNYRYEIRSGSELVAVEECSLGGGRIRAIRRSGGGSSVLEAEAELADTGAISRITLRYARGPFTRNASYEAGDEFLRGSVSALAGRDVVAIKLGRFREIDAGLIVFRALIVAHVLARGNPRWTGRVASIDPVTLVASSQKQSCRRRGDDRHWTYEPRMGDSEEIETDGAGTILLRRDNRGIEAILAESVPG